VTNGLARWSSDRTFGDFDLDSEKFNERNVLFLLLPSAVTDDDPRWNAQT
jgi:hypothetical protein